MKIISGFIVSILLHNIERTRELTSIQFKNFFMYHPNNAYNTTRCKRNVSPLNCLKFPLIIPFLLSFARIVRRALPKIGVFITKNAIFDPEANKNGPTIRKQYICTVENDLISSLSNFNRMMFSNSTFLHFCGYNFLALRSLNKPNSQM